MMGKLKFRFIGALVIMLLMQAAFAYAGKGGLSLSSVTLVGGGSVQDAADVSTEPQFKVQFDKNVVDNSTWANNSQCISLISADGANVPLNVTRMADFNERQNIFVQPAQPLSPGTVYCLKISPNLKAKNGASLGKEVSITFKTKGDAPEQPLACVKEAACQDQTCAAATPAIPAECEKPNDQCSKDNKCSGTVNN